MSDAELTAIMAAILLGREFYDPATQRDVTNNTIKDALASARVILRTARLSAAGVSPTQEG